MFIRMYVSDPRDIKFMDRGTYEPFHVKIYHKAYAASTVCLIFTVCVAKDKMRFHATFHYVNKSMQ